MAIETLPFDAAKYLGSEEAQAELIADALKSGNTDYIAIAIGTVARARGMTKIAKEAGVSREALYKGLAEGGDPRLSTLMGVLRALGMKLTVAEHEAA